MISSTESPPGMQIATDRQSHADGAPLNAWVSLTLRGLEPWIAGAIALYTAWVTVFAFGHVPVLWLFAAYAALVAVWCQIRPAHAQWEVFLRGMALVAGGYMLQTHADAAVGGPSGPFFFWLSITTLYYAFILSPGWGLAATVAAIGAFLLSSYELGQLSEPKTLTHLGFLAIFPTIVAMRFGAAMRRPDAQVERTRTDRSTALYNLRGLFEHGQGMLNACVRDGKPISMVLMDCRDLREIRSIYGASTSAEVLAEVVRKLQAAAGDSGLVVRATATEFVLLLPRTAGNRAQAAVWRALGKPARVECEAGGNEIVVVPDLLVQEISADVDNIAMAYTNMHDRLEAHQQEVARHQRYLTRERERHSRPAGLATAQATTARTAYA